MTVSTTTSVVSYIGNGATTTFTFPFIGVSGTDLQVIITDSTGVQTILASYLYTLAINAPPIGGLWGIGGSVTYPISGTPLQAGSSITINRIVPFEQNISINNQGAFYPAAVEQALDLIEMQLQQTENTSEFSIKVPNTDLVPPNTLPSAIARANGYLAFDGTGQPTIVTNGPTSVGSTAVPRKVTTTGTQTIGLLLSDAFGGISIYQGGGSVTTVQLPSSGGPYPIFDGSGNAGTLPVNILPPAGKTIMGVPSYKLYINSQSATFYLDGTEVLIG